MKKLTSIIAILILGFTSVFGQNLGNVPERPLYFSLQGGPMYSRSDNSFVYEYFDHPFKLVTWQFSGAVGYDFTNAFGLRLNVGYTNNNPGAGNYWNTNYGYVSTTVADDRYFPYTFKSVNGFIDATLNLKGLHHKSSSFAPKLYAGLGFGYTFGFKATDDNLYAPQHNGDFHPWQSREEFFSKRNFVPAFRLGFIAEYNFTDVVGVFADICGEAYGDLYNGLMPTNRLVDYLRGYAGFPFDLRGHVSLGLVFHLL